MTLRSHRSSPLWLPTLVALAVCMGDRAAPEQTAAARPNLLLITVDTLRPDALGWVAGRGDTPAIDRLARDGFRFPAAVAPVPLTLPSHTTIMTGLIPRRHGVRDNSQVFGAGPATLAERLRQRGYATAAFVSGYPLMSLFGLDRGFEVYDDELTAGSQEDLERPATATTNKALAWLQKAPQPWFVWVHYYDPHYPYEPPPELRQPGWRGAYDGEVALVDRAIAELKNGFDRLGGGMIVWAADHGESLGEHGEGTHGFFIYDSTVLVPLIFHFPGRLQPGSSRAPVGLVDIAPTILELLDLPPLEGVDGVSLVPTLLGRPQEIPAVYVETYQPWFSYGWSPLKAIRERDWKLIAAPQPELYNLEQDPGEQHNLLSENPEQARQLERLLRQIESRPPAPTRSLDDPEVLERLRALGYVSSGAAETEPPVADLRDPKSGRELRELLTEADQLLRAGKYRAAVDKFDAVARQDPDNRFAILRSGAALLRLGELPAALTRLRRAVELDPKQPEARAALGEALTQAGKVEEALPQWQELTRLQPRRAQAWSNLGATLGMTGRLQEAIAALRCAAELEPNSAERLAKLAFAEHADHRDSDAIRHLQQAAQLYGKSFPFAGALGLLLAQQHRPEEARKWLAVSRPEEGDFAAARLELAALELKAGNRTRARELLREALTAAPQLKAQVLADPDLAPLVSE